MWCTSKGTLWANSQDAVLGPHRTPLYSCHGHLHLSSHPQLALDGWQLSWKRGAAYGPATRDRSRWRR